MERLQTPPNRRKISAHRKGVNQENHENRPFSEYTNIFQCNILSQFTSAFGTPNLSLSELYSVMRLLKHTPDRKVTI